MWPCLYVFPLSFDFLVPQCRALRGTVFFIPLPLNFWPLPPIPAMCVSTPARTRKTLRIYARTIIEMHWFYVFSCPAEENTSFYRLLIKRFMDNWETSPNVILALLCLCAVKTFFELPFHIIYWHRVARLHPDPAVFFFSRPLNLRITCVTNRRYWSERITDQWWSVATLLMTAWCIGPVSSNKSKSSLPPAPCLTLCMTCLCWSNVDLYLLSTIPTLVFSKEKVPKQCHLQDQHDQDHESVCEDIATQGSQLWFIY